MTTAISKRHRINKENFLWLARNLKTGEEKIVYQGDFLLDLFKRGRAWEVWGDVIELNSEWILTKIKKEKKNDQEQK